MSNVNPTHKANEAYSANPYAEPLPPQEQAPIEQYNPAPQPSPAPQPQSQPSPYAAPVINIVNSNHNSAVATAGGYTGPQKSTTTAYLLWLFLGALGAHKFYLGKTGMGVLYIFTAGLFLVGLAYDLFTMGRQVREFNARGF